MAHSDIFLCGQSSDALLTTNSVITDQKKELSSFVHDISFQETKTFMSFRWSYTLIYISTKKSVCAIALSVEKKKSVNFHNNHCQKQINHKE